MASKKSKILAIAFCAAVMSGIYVNPVLAKDVSVNEHGNVTIRPSDFDNRPGEPDSVLSKYGDNAQQRKLFSAKNY